MSTELSICSIIANIQDDTLTSDKKAKLIDLLMENQQKHDMIIHLMKINRNDLVTSLLKQYLEQSEELDLSNIIRFWDCSLKKASDEMKKKNKNKEDEEIIITLSDVSGELIFQILKLFQSDKNLLKTFNKLPQDNMMLLMSYIKGCMMEHKNIFSDLN
jgi:hypothetical protein